LRLLLLAPLLPSTSRVAHRSESEGDLAAWGLVHVPVAEPCLGPSVGAEPGSASDATSAGGGERERDVDCRSMEEPRQKVVEE